MKKSKKSTGIHSKANGKCVVRTQTAARKPPQPTKENQPELKYVAKRLLAFFRRNSPNWSQNGRPPPPLVSVKKICVVRGGRWTEAGLGVLGGCWMVLWEQKQIQSKQESPRALPNPGPEHALPPPPDPPQAPQPGGPTLWALFCAPLVV